MERLDPGFFKRFGFIVRRRFLTPRQCGQIRTEMRRATSQPGTVWTGSGFAVKRRVRNAALTEVSDRTRTTFDAKLFRLMERTGGHLTEKQKTQFLLYRRGGGYGIHRDARKGSDPTLRQRRFTTLTFLNRQGKGRGMFQGGDLVFYGLIDPSPGIGLALKAEPGLLIGFPPTVAHAVRPVTAGTRLVAVAWLY